VAATTAASWQVAEFNTPEFWPGEVYLDNDKAFYAAVGGGKVNSLSLTQLLNPFGKAMKNMSRASKTVKNHNLKVRERKHIHLASPQLVGCSPWESSRRADGCVGLRSWRCPAMGQG
jgi:hypothetical protein